MRAHHGVDFLLRYLKKGDVIQLRTAGTTTVRHSMIVYDDNATCDGRHKGISGECLNYNKKEILYAQHSDDFDSGHLRALLKDKENGNNILIIKIKNDV